MRYIAKSDNGVGGCELWIALQIPYNGSDQKPRFFQRSMFQVIIASPQLLMVACDLEDQRLLFTVAHAPHQGRGKDVAQDWWAHLSRSIEAYGRGRHCILLIDANARPEIYAPHVGDLGYESSDTARCFIELLRHHDLFLPSTFSDIHHGPTHTWCSNDAQHKARLDYVVVPRQWRNLTLHSQVHQHLDSGTSGLDHLAATLHVSGMWMKPTAKKYQHKFDRDKLAQATPDTWKEFFRCWPEVQWEVDPSTHAMIVEQELQERLAKFFPFTGRRKRNTLQFSAELWRIFTARNRHRKLLSARRRAHDLLLQHVAYRSWVSRRTYTPMDVDTIKYILRISTVWQAHKTDNHCIRRMLSQERAAHIKKIGASIDGATRSDIMQRLAPFRLGQRKRDLGRKPLPMIALESGAIASTPQQARDRWRRHFAGMEGGSVVDRSELLQQVSTPQEQPSMELHQIPSLFELERQLRASKTQKSMGPDNIPGELLHYAPQHIAHVLWPLYIKQALTISEAVQYKGGRLVMAYKRRGDYTDCNSHRAPLVSSSLGKAMHNTFRRRAMAFVRSSAGDMQITSHSQPSVQLAAHAVRAHMNMAKRTSTGAFALFLDISHAGVLSSDSSIRL